MPSTDFPTGPWTGYYRYPNGERGQQDLRLVFQSGKMVGAGTDELGPFVISGSYSETQKEAQWVKGYPDGHTVFYRGFREGPVEGLWGEWSILGNWSGGFHIWPLGSKQEPLTADKEAQPLPNKKREQVFAER
jgi:hypothetical protein